MSPPDHLVVVSTRGQLAAVGRQRDAAQRRQAGPRCPLLWCINVRGSRRQHWHRALTGAHAGGGAAGGRPLGLQGRAESCRASFSTSSCQLKRLGLLRLRHPSSDPAGTAHNPQSYSHTALPFAPQPPRKRTGTRHSLAVPSNDTVAMQLPWHEARSTAAVCPRSTQSVFKP